MYTTSTKRKRESDSTDFSYTHLRKTHSKFPTGKQKSPTKQTVESAYFRLASLSVRSYLLGHAALKNDFIQNPAHEMWNYSKGWRLNVVADMKKRSSELEQGLNEGLLGTNRVVVTRLPPCLRYTEPATSSPSLLTCDSSLALPIGNKDYVSTDTLQDGHTWVSPIDSQLSSLSGECSIVSTTASPTIEQRSETESQQQNIVQDIDPNVYGSMDAFQELITCVGQEKAEGVLSCLGLSPQYLISNQVGSKPGDSDTEQSQKSVTDQIRHTRRGSFNGDEDPILPDIFQETSICFERKDEFGLEDLLRSFNSPLQDMELDDSFSYMQSDYNNH